MQLGNLALRLFTVAPLIPILLLAMFWSNPLGLWAIVYAASGIALVEFFGIVLSDPAERAFGVGAGLAAAALLYHGGAASVALVPLVVIAPALFYLFRFGDLQTVMPRVALTTLGVAYAGLLPTYLAMLKRDAPHGGGWVLLALTTAWLGDSCAYFAGRLFGRAKLYPAISPGKTRAGAFGGLAGSFLAAVVANLWYLPELGWVHGAALTLVGGALGQCGDLVESMLKRAFGVKDSGKILPGHGGMLDRIDAVIFIAPWVYAYHALVWSRV